MPARLRLLLALPIAFALTACDMSLGNLTGRASDEWTRTYQLAPGGEVHIGNTNGRIEIEGVDGSTVEVRAERIARAATDAGARELLPRITIKEDVKPDRVSIETDRLGGIMIGVNFEVRYHVRAPKQAVVNVSNTNGTVQLSRLAGRVEARTTNGAVSMDLSSVGTEKIRLSTTNGGVALYLPETAKADVSASWTNGGINLSDLKMEVTERSKRRFEGRMNGGGAPIELHTTNGGIRIRSRSEAPAATDDDRDSERDEKSVVRSRERR